MSKDRNKPPTYAPTVVLIITVFLTGCGLGIKSGNERLYSSFVRDSSNKRAPELRTATAELAKIENLQIPGPGGEIPIRIYAPQGSGQFPVLLYFHGGGWIFGGLNTHDNVCQFFAGEANCIVISVDYRLAPRHKFPAAIEDAFAALQWTSENAGSIKVDAKRIAVGGDSAGGNIACAVCLMARDRGAPSPVFQLLAFPVTNLAAFDTDSYRSFSTGFGLTKTRVEWYRSQYLSSNEDPRNPYISPLLAADLSHLPPALVITGEYDVLRDEGETYVSRLQLEGVQAKYIRSADKGHAALEWALVSAGLRFILDEAAASLRSAFSK
jgi:acetyl esterase